MLSKWFVYGLIAVFCVLQASVGLTASMDECVTGSSPRASSMSSNDPHRCCCQEKSACCCETEQKPIPQLPDMALNATPGGSYEYVPRFATSDVGTQSVVSFEHQERPGVLNETGPPFTSFYLTNLNFRC